VCSNKMDYDVFLGIDMVPGREGGTWLGASKRGRIGTLLTILGANDSKKKGRGKLNTTICGLVLISN